MELRPPLRALVVEADDGRFAALADALGTASGFDVRLSRVHSVEEAQAALAVGAVDVCLAPSKLGPDESATLTLVAARAPEFIPVVAVVEGRHVAAGVEAVRDEGAATFLLRGALEAGAVDRALFVAVSRRDAVLAFRRERAAFDAVFDLTPDPVVVLDAQGRIVRLNAAAEDAAGRPSGALFGRPFWALFEGADRRAVLEHFRRGEAEGFPLTFRQAWTTGDGRRLSTRWTARRLPETGGVLVYGEAPRGPDAARTAAREAILASVAQRPVILAAVDAAGLFTLCEGAGLDTIGVEGAALLGQSLFEVYGDAAERLDHFRRALAGETLDVVVGTQGRIYETRYAPLSGPEGTPAGAVMGAWDVTDAVAERRQLRQFACALDHVADAVSLADGDGQALYANPAFERLFGLDVEALNARGGVPALYAEGADAAAVFEVTRAGEVWEGDVALRRADGRPLRVHLRADTVLDGEGHRVGLVATYREG